MRLLIASLIAGAWVPQVDPAIPADGPLHRTVELNRGEAAEVELWNGRKVRLKLLEVGERRDPIRSAVRDSWVRIQINGEEFTLGSSGYRLPTTVAGVQIDCPVTRAWYVDSRHDYWGLRKDARFRLWPAGSPWARPGWFVYPVRQRWFASDTHMGNEPCYCGGNSESRGPGKIYYHFGLDFGGCENRVDVVSVSDGVVAGLAGEYAPEHRDAKPFHGFDPGAVLILDPQGGYHRYCHFAAMDPALRIGGKVNRGQRLGLLGKTSGVWSHLHHDMRRREADGHWVLEDGYAFLWEAYQREFAPEILAVARPHHLIWAGESATLDAGRSWGASKLARFEWIFSDGTRAEGERVEKAYPRPGTYSEILRVTDVDGRVGYDFAVVLAFDKENPKPAPPTIQAAYAPSFGIRPGDPVTFKVRTFGTTNGDETWDFGDGTPPVKVRSDGAVEPEAPDGFAVTTHSYGRAGIYLAKVERTDARGATATARLHVHVGEPTRPSKPFGGKPQAIPGSVEVENFDEGGPGVAYFHRTDIDYRRAPPGLRDYRPTERIDVSKHPNLYSNGYGVCYTRAGEWLAYTVEVQESGTYTVEAPVACKGNGGVFHLEFDGKDVTGPLRVPYTRLYTIQTVVRKEGIPLHAGTYVMKVYLDAPGDSDAVGDFDCFRFTRTD